MNDTTPTAAEFVRRVSGGPSERHGSAALPDDVVIGSAKRLRALALVYASAFAMVTVVPAALSDDGVGAQSGYGLVVTCVSVAVVLLVTAVTTRSPASGGRRMRESDGRTITQRPRAQPASASGRRSSLIERGAAEFVEDDRNKVVGVPRGLLSPLRVVVCRWLGGHYFVQGLARGD